MTTSVCDLPGSLVLSLQDRGVSQSTPAWPKRALASFIVSCSIIADTSATLLNRVERAAAEAAAPNWDGERAAAVEGSTRDFARMFASALPAGVPTPEVSIDRDGDIAFDWDEGPRRVFSVSVSRDGTLNFAGLFGPNTIHGSEVLDRGIPPTIAYAIKRVHAGL